jgi:hypothetical protein
MSELNNLSTKRIEMLFEDIGYLKASVERLEREWEAKQGQEAETRFFLCLPRVEC